MVFYFTSNAIDPPVTIYMGKDKFENEELIRHGWPNDVWFHVDKLSSAHVYLRLPSGIEWTDIPQPLLIDLAQLTKANSIEGNKKDHIIIIYTPWSNLKKSGDMDTGQVTFHQNKTVKRIKVDVRSNEILNRLNKTKTEEFPDFLLQKTMYEKNERKLERDRSKINQRRDDIDAKKREKKDNGYDKLFKEDEMYSNKGLDMSRTVTEIEDDFM